MPPTVNRCLLFDNDAAELRNRLRDARDVLEYLHNKGAVVFAHPFEEPHFWGFTRRDEVLDELLHTPDALLIADLTDDGGGAFAGNIGARLIRAVAQRPETRDLTRRVVWSKHNIESVAQDVLRWAHAFALQDASDGVEYLSEAIVRALAPDSDNDAPRVFPGVRSHDQLSNEIKARLGQLVKEIRNGDSLIAIRLAQDIDRSLIAAELELSKPRLIKPRSSVNKFLEQVQTDQGMSSKEAEDEIRRVMRPYAVDHVPDAIKADQCRQALAIRRNLVEEYPDGRHRDQTWLTAEEDELAATFLALFARGVKDRKITRPHEERQTNALIQEILGVEGVLDPHPEWVAACERFRSTRDDIQASDIEADNRRQALKVGRETLSYVVWSLIDFRRRR